MITQQERRFLLKMIHNTGTAQRPEAEKTAIGRRIRQLRLQYGLSQEDFAESISVSTNFISELETGKKGMSMDTLCRLCYEYHVSADMILFGKIKSHSVLEHMEHSLNSIPTEDIPTIISYLQSLYKIRRM